MLLALWVTWRRARQRVIGKLEAAGWSVIWILAAVVVMLPNVASSLAQRVGVGRGVDLVMYASVAGLFILVFKLFIQHEKIERKLTEAVRQEALRGLEPPPEKYEPSAESEISLTQQTLQAFMFDASLGQPEPEDARRATKDF